MVRLLRLQLSHLVCFCESGAALTVNLKSSTPLLPGRMIRADVEEPGRFYVLDDRLELLEQ